MKSLKEIVLEGILDLDGVSDFDTNQNFAEESVMTFIKENYRGCEKVKLKYNKKTNLFEASVRTRNAVKFIGNGESLTNGLFIWKKVPTFECSNSKNLKSLKGAPEKFDIHFKCSDCPELTSLEDANFSPDYQGNFYCDGCSKLTSLKGCPIHVTSYLDVSGTSIKDFTDGPKIVNTIIATDCPNLTSLNGCPQHGCTTINASNCRKLTSLKGCPDSLFKLNIDLSGVINFKEGPKSCMNIRACRCLNLISTKGIAQDVEYLTLNECPNLKKIEGFTRDGKLRDIAASNCKELTTVCELPDNTHNVILSYCPKLSKVKRWPEYMEKCIIRDCNLVNLPEVFKSKECQLTCPDGTRKIIRS